MGVGVVAAVSAALVAAVASGALGLMPRMMLDRVSPLAEARTVWLRVEDPDGYADSYADATGGTDYIYVASAATEGGGRAEVGLISFGQTVGGWVRGQARGFYVGRWELVEASEVPEAARAALAAS